tara:strand:- start:1335 stop:1592 length:258 start_codon:yes stop_codon:yes gene_type:complete
MKDVTKSLAAVALLIMSSACSTARQDTSPVASASNRSSYCLADKKLPIRAAPADMVDDPGNRYDPDVTTKEKLEHNRALDRACTN